MSRPVPTALKLVRGNPGRRPIDAANEPKPRAGVPTCPTHLKGEARREWRRIVPELTRCGLLTKVDRAALAAYCQAWSRWVTAETQLDAEGLLTVTPNGHTQPSPYLSIANRALEQLHRFSTEFGLTPSSRTRLRIEKPEQPDELEQFIQKQG